MTTCMLIQAPAMASATLTAVVSSSGRVSQTKQHTRRNHKSQRTMTMCLKLHHLVAVLSTLFGITSCQLQGLYGPAQSEVTVLPLWNAPLPSPQYAGYINIPRTSKYIFYHLIVSQQRPAEDPLVVSLPGGPGGSIADLEIVPFLYRSSFADPANPSLIPENLTVTQNPYTWAKAANLLLMDSVAGVGYSYSKNESDYSTRDSQAQTDLEATLREWCRTYPFFANHSVFLQGRSYAGKYVPLLGEAILQGNDQGATPPINLQGYLIGNGVTDSSTDNINIFSLFSSWPLIPQTLAAKLTDYKCGTLSNPIDADTVQFTGSNTTQVSACTELTEQVHNLISYNVNSLKWTGDCFYGMQTFIETLASQISGQLATEGVQYNQSLAGTGGSAGAAAGCYTDERGGAVSLVLALYDSWGCHPLLATSVLKGSRAAHLYFNRADVRQALHVQAVQEEAGLWLALHPRVGSAYKYDIPSVLPQHAFLISRGVRALVYSGGLDWQVPWTGSEHWASQLDPTLGLLAGWRPWFRPDPFSYGSQLSGYITQYRGLAFMTFKAAGHHVTSDAPADAYTMLTNFLANTLNATTVYTDFAGGLQSSTGIQ